MTTGPEIHDQDVKRLIQTQTPVVEKIAKTLARRLPASVERDDLIQDGMVGLIEALLRWTREATGAHFENYVAQRARGAMLDGLRALDPGTRKRRREMRRVESAIQQLGHLLGRAPLEVEVASALGWPLEEYQSILQDVHGYALVSLDDILEGEGNAHQLSLHTMGQMDPLALLERSTVRQALWQEIQALPEQKRWVLRLYYEEDLKMHEIGARMQISEARVSQLHSHTIAYLRASLHGDSPGDGILKQRSKPR
jgi:RNA polymerase sigma factor for flagellar operon FliA